MQRRWRQRKAGGCDMGAQRAIDWAISTRDLLVCATVGVVCGLVMLPAVYLQITVTATMPMLYTMFTGTFILAPVLAQALIRRPGAAVIAAIVAALATAPLSPRGILAVGPMALVGTAFELAGLTGRYLSWPKWRWYLTAAIFSLFSITTITVAFDLLSLRPTVAALTIAAIPLSYLLATWLALVIAAKLTSAGIGFQPATRAQHGYQQHSGNAGDHDGDQ